MESLIRAMSQQKKQHDLEREDERAQRNTGGLSADALKQAARKAALLAKNARPEGPGAGMVRKYNVTISL